MILLWQHPTLDFEQKKFLFYLLHWTATKCQLEETHLRRRHLWMYTLHLNVHVVARMYTFHLNHSLYSKYTLLPPCFSSVQWKCTHFVTSRHILWIRKITKYTSDFYVVEMLLSVSKLSHNHQGSIDLWTANIHQNVGFYFLILLCQYTNKH